LFDVHEMVVREGEDVEMCIRVLSPHMSYEISVEISILNLANTTNGAVISVPMIAIQSL